MASADAHVPSPSQTCHSMMRCSALQMLTSACCADDLRSEVSSQVGEAALDQLQGDQALPAATEGLRGQGELDVAAGPKSAGATCHHHATLMGGLSAPLHPAYLQGDV